MEARKLEPEYLNRSFPLLTEAGIRHLETRKILVAGCGGIGGSVAMTLARMGARNFHLADPANFDAPDMNRQWGAFRSTLGRPKVEVYRDILTDIHPQTEIKLFRQGITPHNYDEFLEGGDLLIDCLDVSVAYELREGIHARARAKKIFSVAAPILGFGCAAICSSPDGMSMKAWTSSVKHTKTKTEFPPVLNQIFMPEHLDLIGKSLAVGRVPSVSVGPVIAASLLATESIAYLLDGIIPGFRKPIVLPKVMFFDLFRMSYHVLDATPVLKQVEGSEESYGND